MATTQSQRTSRSHRTFLFSALCTLVLSGCASMMSPEQATVQAQGIADDAGMNALLLPSGRFLVAAFVRGLERETPRIHVYIEGDGRAWRGRRQPPLDPTPTNPVALRLAAADPAPAVVYLARPCQYVADDPGCSARDWTSGRYAPAVIAALGQALDTLTREAPRRRLVLIGHSGGGVVAALLAARRDDVAALVTLASPLSVATWTSDLGLSPLSESLDPATLDGDARIALAALPQRHYLGTEDAIVPARAVREFINTLPSPNRAELELVVGIDHQCCWLEDWPTRLDAALR